MDLPQLLQRHAEQFVQPRLQDVVSQYQQELFELADKAPNNQLQASLFANQKQVLQCQEQILSGFAKAMAQQLDDFVKAKTAAKTSIDDQQVEDLSLLDKAELEDDLAVTVVSNRSNNQHTEVLWKLNRRLAVIRGGKAVNDESNPFGAFCIANCAQRAIAVLTVQGKPKLLFYKVLERVLLADLGELYERLNQALLEKGVLPNLKYQLAKSANKAAAMPQTQPAEAVLPTAPVAPESVPVVHFDNADEQRQQQVLQALLGQLQQASSPLQQQAQSYFTVADDMAAGQSPDSFNSTDFAMALSCLQSELPNSQQIQAADINQLNERFFAQLASMQKSLSRNQLAIDDLSKVELVGQLFSQILSDEVLADNIKALLSHLHTPILKVALIDSSFLQQPSHSVRRFLALLTDLGAKYAGNEALERSLLNKFKAIVARILHEFVDDVGVFAELNQELVQFADTLAKRAEVAEQRNIDAAKGVAKLAEAKAQAELRVRKHLSGRRLPDVIMLLFAKPWLDFVTFNILRHGNQSTLVKQALQVIDQLIWSLEPEQITQVPELEYQRRQKRLQRMILSGLATAGLDKPKQEELMAELARLQQQARQNAEQETPLAQAVSESHEFESEAVEPIEGQEETAVVETQELKTEAESADAHESAIYKQSSSAQALADNKTRFLAVEEQSSQADVLRQTAQAASQYASLSTKQNIGEVALPMEGKTTQIERQLAQQSQQKQAAEAAVSELDEAAAQPALGDQSLQQNIAEPQLGSTELEQAMATAEPRLDESEIGEQLANWRQSLEGLSFGSWYYRLHQGQKQLMKLAWFSELSDSYMFVNQAGVKVANLSGRELAIALQQAVIYEAEDSKPNFMEKLFGGLLQKNRNN